MVQTRLAAKRQAKEKARKEQSSDSGYDTDQAPTSSTEPPKPKKPKVSPQSLTWDQMLINELQHLQSSDKTMTEEHALVSLLVKIQKDQLGNLYKFLKGDISDRHIADHQRNWKLQYGLYFDKTTELVMSRSRNFRIDDQLQVQKPIKTKSEDRLMLAPVDQDLVFLTAEGDKVKALVKAIHETGTGHGSTNHVAAESRRHYWILHIRKIAKDVRKHCSRCKLLDAQAVTQLEGALPACRYDTSDIQSNIAFHAIGVDFVGPFYPYRDKTKKIKGQNMDVAHIAVFSCAKTRAIHLEPLKEINFEHFELAFRNFTSRRGSPKLVYSDNAKTFKLAEKLSVFNEAVSKKLKNTYQPHMKWIFNANRAPWWGGFFERMMRIIKDKLARNFYRHVFPSPDHFRSAVTLLEQYINSRPLTTFYSDRQELSPITPDMFLRPGSTPNPIQFLQFRLLPTNTKSMTAIEAKHRRKALAEFQRRLWFDFQHLYLHHLRQFHKTAKTKDRTPELKPGLCVLITPDDTSFKPGSMWQKVFWRRGQVDKLFKGKDGRCRSAQVSLKDKSGKIFSTVYPVQKLCPLELSGTEKAEFLKAPNV
jgi:hypothetical protein